MQHTHVPRSRASLLQPGGEGFSGRGATSGQIRQCSARRNSERLSLKASAQYQRGQGRSSSSIEQQRRPQDQYDYDFPPPPGTSRQPPGPPNRPPQGPGGPEEKPSNFKDYLIAGAFFIGIGTGVWFDSGASFTPSNVASTEIVDRKTPNSEICMASGYSSMVFDQRLFVSFNPFNVYVAQPEVKPGCVLRQSSVNVLEKRKLVTDKEVAGCTRSSNTFAFVGDLEKSPEVSCVYHSEDAENQFLRNPKRAVLGDGFRGSETASAPSLTSEKGQ